MDGSEHDGDELWEFDAETVDIEGILESLEFVISIVELDEVEKISELGENLIVSQKVKHMLIGNTELLLLFLLLVLNDEVIKKYLVEFIEMLLNRYFDPLLRRFLIFTQI